MTRILFIAIFCLFTVATAQAEQIVVPVGQQAAYNQHLNRPKTGISKARVLEKYGEPNRRNPAVGDPPISSWDYDKFTVFFEYDHVIHSVLKVEMKQ